MARSDFLLPDEPLAVALVDTLAIDRGQPVDLLTDEPQLASWLDAQRERLGDVAEAPSLRDLHLLRDGLRRLFAATVDGTAPDKDAIRLLNEALARGGGQEVLVWDAGNEARQVRRGDSVLGRIARSAVRLLANDEPGPLRRCANPRCVLYFAASNRRRVFCSAACSLRVRVARHAAAHR